MKRGGIMLKWFKRKKEKKGSLQEGPVYQVQQLKMDELDQFPRGVEQIVDRELDGFIISDFLTEAETEKIKAAFYGLPEGEITEVVPGFDCYPKTFAQFEQGVAAGAMEPAQYFKKSSDFRDAFSSNFGVDLEGRVSAVLGKIAPEKKVTVPVDLDAHGTFVPFTIRDLKPGLGHLKAHCENYFFHEFPAFFDRFRHFTKNEEQLSFFVVLQHSESGGELTLFNLQWSNTRKRPDDHTVMNIQGELLNLEDPTIVWRDQFRPQTGSLVIFRGGDIWHRVENIGGSRSRITAGGFISFSPDKGTLYLWS